MRSLIAMRSMLKAWHVLVGFLAACLRAWASRSRRCLCDRAIEDGRPELNAVPSAIARASAAVERGRFRFRLAVPPAAFAALTAATRFLTVASFFSCRALAALCPEALVKGMVCGTVCCVCAVTSTAAPSPSDGATAGRPPTLV